MRGSFGVGCGSETGGEGRHEAGEAGGAEPDPAFQGENGADNNASDVRLAFFFASPTRGDPKDHCPRGGRWGAGGPSPELLELRYWQSHK